MAKSLGKKYEKNKLTFLKEAQDSQGKQLAHALCFLMNDIKDEGPRNCLLHFLELYPIRKSVSGEVIKIGPGQKRSGGRLIRNKFARWIKKIFPCWRQRLFILTSDGLGYCNNSDDHFLKDNMFLDSSLQISCSQLSNNKSLTIIVRTSSRKMKIRLIGVLDGFLWVYAFIKAIERSRYCKIHRFGSFAPHCDGNSAKWYINAENYFADIAETIKNATSKIYITDWMLSPELYLKRPFRFESEKPEDHEYRLDNLLLEAAKRGCKVHILLYKEFDHALPNNSKHAKEYLEGLHSNITVLRHPGILTMLWSHHEKLVIVDQTFCFMGGLDLCFGRYDTQEYHLKEPNNLQNGEKMFYGKDFYNVRFKDFKNVHEWNLNLIDPESQPRMPWRDIAIQLTGEVVKDATRHFIQYWNFVKVDLSLKQGKMLNRAVTKKAGDDSPMRLPLNKKRSSIIHVVQEDIREDSSDEEDNKPFLKAIRKLKSDARRDSEPPLSMSQRLKQKPSFLGELIVKYVEKKDQDIKIIKKSKNDPILNLRIQNEAKAIVGASIDKKKSVFDMYSSLKLTKHTGDSDLPMSIRTITVKAPQEEDWYLETQTVMASLVYYVSVMERYV